MKSLQRLPHHDNASKTSDGSRSLSNLSIASGISTAASQLRERLSMDLYAGHASDCVFCKKCTACYETHCRHAEYVQEDPFHASESLIPDHSRVKHEAEGHHHPRCVCRCCTGRGPPGGRSMHVEGCMCDICHRPGLSRVPKKGYRWGGSGASNSGGVGSLMIGGGGEAAV